MIQHLNNHRGFTHEVLTHCAPRSGWSCCLVAHGSHGHGPTQRNSRRRHVQEVEEQKEVINAQVGFTGTNLRPEATAPGFLCLPLSTRRERGPYCRAMSRTGCAPPRAPSWAEPPAAHTIEPGGTRVREIGSTLGPWASRPRRVKPASGL